MDSVLPKQNSSHVKARQYIGHALGGDCGHTKAFGISLLENSVRKICWADMPCVCWGEH